MFVSENTLKEIRQYFTNSLVELYPENEVNSFFYILCEAYLGFSKSEIQLKLNSHLSESELLKFHYAIKELKKFKPVQYIIENQYFYDNEFVVNENVLIPRPETEELVDLIIKENQGKGLKVLDIGTGSGAIAISLSLFLINSEVTAFDVSEGALEVAKQNNQNLNGTVDFQKVDILNHKSESGNFSVIVSNPPYVLNSEKNLMKANVLDYEPHLALFVEDNDPLIFYRKIIEFGVNNLAKNGKIYFEINEKYGDEVVVLLEQNSFEYVELIKDIQGKDRIVKGELR